MLKAMEWLAANKRLPVVVSLIVVAAFVSGVFVGNLLDQGNLPDGLEGREEQEARNISDWGKYEGNPSWGSTRITDQWIATDWLKLPNLGNITWGADYDVETFYNATTNTLEWAGANLAFSGNITANYLIGNASLVTGISDWNVTGANLYPYNLSWNVGIGTTSPATELEVENGTITIDQDQNAISLNIDSESMNTNVLNIASQVASGYSLYIENIQTHIIGAVAYFKQSGPSAGVPVLELENEGTGNCLFLDNNGGGRALNIDSEATGGCCVNIDSAETTGKILNINADSLTNGIGIDLTSTSDIFNGRLLNIDNTVSGNILSNTHTETAKILLHREEQRTSGTTYDDSNALALRKELVMNGAGGAIVDTGAVLEIYQTVTETAGTLTSSSEAIEIGHWSKHPSTVYAISIGSTNLGTGGSGGIRIHTHGNGTGIRIYTYGNGTALNIESESTTGNIIDIDTSKFVLSHDGNVGIGTMNPNSLLHLKGGCDVDLIVESYSVAESGNATLTLVGCEASGLFPGKISVHSGGMSLWVPSEVPFTSTEAMVLTPTWTYVHNKLWVKGATGDNIFGVTDGTATGVIYIDKDYAVPVQFGSESDHNIGFFTHDSLPQMILTTAGNAGIGRTPVTNKLEVEGDASKATSGDWLANSDRRIKTGIQDIDNALDTILRIRPVKFKYTNEYKQLHPSVEDKYYYNFIAQEYQEVFPESVKGSGEYLEGDSEEILQMDSYNARIVAIKAIQELKAENDALEFRIEQLEDNKLPFTILNIKYESLQMQYEDLQIQYNILKDDYDALEERISQLEILVQGLIEG